MRCLWCRTRTSLQWSSQWAPQTLGASCGLLVDIESNIFWAPLYFWYVTTQEVIIGLLSGTHQTHSWGLAGILLNGVPEVHIYLCHSWNCQYWVICSINTLQVLPFLSILLKFWSILYVLIQEAHGLLHYLYIWKCNKFIIIQVFHFKLSLTIQ